MLGNYPAFYNMMEGVKRMMEDMMNDNVFEPIPMLRSRMRSDVIEFDDHYKVEVEIPGFDKEEINLSYSNGFLVIKADRNLENKVEDTKAKYLYKEREITSLTRTLKVSNVDEDKITASLKNGVLEVILPKKEVQTNKQIPIS